MDQGDEEGMVQHSPPLGSNDSSEGNNVKSTEYVAIAEEVPESGNDDEKENEKEKSKVESEGKMEFSAKNRLRQRVTRNSALC
ncbi:unnamed protein product [Microthlaspi erraticum]|uniref:Uncharacterized protein n=1 Tax=Microthlaspi erraticum TaxID=1685480 RepID=A0A6D2IE32_9BRAS|nr:unnamed protein product [Microthlaspi erraticum]